MMESKQRQDEENLDHSKYNTIEAASNFLDPVSSDSEIPADINATISTLSEDGTSLEESHVRKDLLTSSKRAAALEEQSFPSVSLADSILREDGFYGASGSFEILHWEEGNRANILDEAVTNSRDDGNYHIFISENEEAAPVNSDERVFWSKSMLKDKMIVKSEDGTKSTSNGVNLNVSKSMKTSKKNQVIRSVPLLSHQAKSGGNFSEHMRKEKMKQHRQRVLAAVSTMQSDNKLSRATMELQLRNAVKKVEAYSKINQSLLKRLEASTVDEEFGKYKAILHEQDQIIARLVEENKALERIARSQAKHLLASNTDIGSNGIIISPDGMIKVLNKKIRELHEILSTTRKKLNGLKDEIDNLRGENRELRKRVNKQSTKIRFIKEQKSTITEEHYKDGSSDDAEAVKRRKGELFSGRTLKSSSDKLTGMKLDSERKISLLEKRLDYRKKEHERFRINTNEEISGYKERIDCLEKEIEAKDRLSRVQVVEVKRLQQTCKDLSFGNKQLQLASDFYTNVEADLKVKFQKSINSPSSGVVDMKFTKPEPPLSRSGKGFARSVRVNQ